MLRLVSFALVTLSLSACSATPAPVTPSSPGAAPASSVGGASPAGQAEGQADPPIDPDNLVEVSEEIDIAAPVEKIWPVFDDPQSYWSILPMVKAVTPRGHTDDGALLVELEQGIAFVTGSYTAKIHKLKPHEIALSIDRRFPSVLRDGRGSVSLLPTGPSSTHVVFKMRVDLGDKMVLHMLKGRIRSALQRPPQLLKEHMAKLP